MLHCTSVYIRQLPPRQIIHNYTELGQLHSSIKMINIVNQEVKMFIIALK